MKFKDIDIELGKLLGYTIKEGKWLWDGEKIVTFQPTTRITDAFKLIDKYEQDGYAWGVRSVCEDKSKEVQVGKGYAEDKSIPLAICKAVLKHEELKGGK